MLDLPDVTLCAIDTRAPELALRALEHSRRGIRFARSLLLTDAAPASGLPEGIEVGTIAAIGSAADYSSFVLTRLRDWITTRQVLVVQWDGFVIDPTAWDPGFAALDYLGAPWGRPRHGEPPEHRVGNGGFSLRSRRLLQCLTDPAIGARLHHPEDVCIGRTLRPWLEREKGIVFGSTEQAARFAFENEPAPGPTFGFHGMFNLPQALGPAAFAELLDKLPAATLGGRDGFKTARALWRAGEPRLALRLLERRAVQAPLDWRCRWLCWRCELALKGRA